MNLPQETLEYIISFLVGNDKFTHKIGYTNDVTEYHRYAVVIKPSGFFDEGTYATEASIPKLPLQEIDDVPILFGTTHKEWVEKTLVVHADVVASAFYFMTRYEELVNHGRDEHNRFDAKHSFMKEAQMLMRPWVDELGELVNTWLYEVGERDDVYIPVACENVCITHDVDCLDYYHSVRGVLGGLKRILKRQTREKLQDIYKSWCNIEHDPAYTFPWMAEQHKILPDAQVMYFMKAAGEFHHYDRPRYNLKSKKLRNFYRFCQNTNAKLGLHCSYLAGQKPELLQEEKKRLEEAIGVPVTHTRYHYLRSCSIKDMQELVNLGVTDDYTMGFADEVGFRLGTTRPVRWINPETMQLTSLTLHPLSVMDCTLLEPRYMGLDEETALTRALIMLDATCVYRGEYVMLFHNTSFMGDKADQYKKIYVELLNYIHKIQLLGWENLC